MKKFFNEFKEFAVKGNMIDLAIGVMIGTAFSAVTNSIVKDIFMPFIGLLMNGIDFSALCYKIGEASINYGLLIQAVLNFIITAFVLFLTIKFIAKLKREPEKEEVKEEVKEPEIPEDIKLLTEIRDLLKKQ
ncbi:MAG: large conductance mechanosensitive channel protein MscL [Ruminococcaceae bacterium]|nr:large conductance mechanosensitive channel protein MscL [Oscillospiraceae bacterium]